MVRLRAETLTTRLRDLGVATPQQLDQAKQELFQRQERFSAILVRQGVLRDVEAGKRLAIQLGAIPQRVEASPITVAAVTQIPLTTWSGHRLVPFQELDGTVLLATDDPLSVFALDFLKGQCGCPLDAVLIREQDFSPLLEQFGHAAVAATTSPAAPTAPADSPGPSAPATSFAPTSSPAPVPPARLSREPPAPALIIGGPGGRASPSTPQAVAGPSPALQTAAEARAVIPPSEPPTAQGATPSRHGGSDAPTPPHEEGDEPIIRLVDSMLAEAVRMRASDVHVEPGREQLRVRYRIDGVLHDVNSPPKALQGSITSRIKILAGLNIAEKRLPQDGRLQMFVGGRPLDVRISSLPASHGESLVMRLLDRSQPIRGLPEMGILPEDQQHWEELIHRPHGMVLVTGPTGSGKTTTLYGALAMLNRPDRKLITVEDPVEYQLRGVNQVAVKSSIGLTFSAGLRAMLRQAPDVIMVGEIRDQETAQIAIQAALTGHLVLSTLHTNDASSAVTRLIDMGIAPFLVASTVQGVLAQRLVRRICPSCRITDNATPEERAFLGEPEVLQVVHSTGCDACHESGFVGRIGIFELLLISDAIRQLIVTKATASAIQAAALREDMRRLRDDGCAKIREGLTTMAEVLRVVSDG